MAMQLAQRRGRDAIAWARGQHEDGGSEWEGMCLMFVRLSYMVPLQAPSAAAAWKQAEKKHRTNDGNNAPRGVPFFWTGGSHGMGHIVLSVGGGLCWSNDTDRNRPGTINLVRINDITRMWGQNPEGWTEDLNGLLVWKPAELPKVDLSNVRSVFFLALDGHRTPFLPGVLRIQKALNAKYDAHLALTGRVSEDDLNAYGRHEQEVGVSGRPRIPDEETLSKLGKGRFQVVA